MFVCIYNENLRIIDHLKELTEEQFADEWPLYELECVNRGYGWLPYNGIVQYTLPAEELHHET